MREACLPAFLPTYQQIKDMKRQKKETEKLYHFPDQEDEAEATQSRQQRLFSKLNQKYREDKPRGGPPEMTEEERFWQEKEKQAKHTFGSKSKRERKEEK